MPVFAQRSTLNAELLEGAKHREADITFDKVYPDSNRLAGAIRAAYSEETRSEAQ